MESYAPTLIFWTYQCKLSADSAVEIQSNVKEGHHSTNPGQLWQLDKLVLEHHECAIWEQVSRKDH